MTCAMGAPAAHQGCGPGGRCGVAHWRPAHVPAGAGELAWVHANAQVIRRPLRTLHQHRLGAQAACSRAPCVPSALSQLASETS